MKIRNFVIVLIAMLVANETTAQGLLNRPNLSRNNNRNASATPGANQTLPAGAPGGSGGGEAFASEANDDEGLTSDLNFRNAELDQIFMIYGRLVERTVLKDPNTPNLVLTFQSRRGHKLSKEEQIEAIEVLLEMNGIHFENYGDKFVRAISRKEARQEGIPLYLDIDDPEIAKTLDGRVISVNLAFKNIAIDEAKTALEGFKSNSGLLQVFERTNSIVITDTKQNIMRMAQIAKLIDIATPVNEIVEVVQIKNASAADIQQVLKEIVDDAAKYQEKDPKNRPNTGNNNTPRLLQMNPSNRLGLGNPNSRPPAPTALESLITSVSDADRGMIRGRVLIVPDERSNKLIIVTNKTNMDFFKKVIEALDIETTPDTVVKVYRLKYADAEDVSGMMNDLIGNAPNSSNSSGKGNQNQNARSGTGSNLTRGTTANNAQVRKSANQRSGEAKAGELSKDNTTVLADKRINGLVVMTQKELVPTVESIIESMDVKLSQVLIETMILEVALEDGLETGVDWVKQRTGDFRRGNYMLGGGAGNTDLSSAKFDASDVANWGVSPIGTGAKYFLKADKLDLAAAVKASKDDTRTKYLASPVVMTVDNKEATIDATDMRYLFKGYQYSGSTYSGSAVPDYEQKEIGIKIKVKPKINPNGTVMLNLDVSYEKVGTPQNITMAIPDADGKTKTTLSPQETTTTRKMTADAILDNGQSVILGGMVRNTIKDVSNGIPILKDIPWIGKWLFGKVEQRETRTELLIFLTPYVLNDAESAQAEAFRRKKSFSDVRPWDDHGWSASELADPVSKKEVLRRLKDEAAKQDEERNTRIAIEKWKMDRAKALEKMSEEERKLWMESHKEELDKEAKEKFEKDAKEQEDLQLLAEMIKEQRAAEEERTLEGKSPSQEK